MKIALITTGILVAVTATPIAKLEVEEPLKNTIDILKKNFENDKKLQVTMTKSNLLSKPDANQAFDSNPEDKKGVNTRTPLKYNINGTEARLKTAAILKKLSGLKQSLNAIQGSKFNECAYEAVKTFVVCELHLTSEMEDVEDIFPFIKCASAAAKDFVNCFFHKSELHTLREDIGANEDIREMYKTFNDIIMKMFGNFDDIDVQKVNGYENTPEVIYYNSI